MRFSGILLFVLVFNWSSVFADIPHTLNYQGRLMNPQNQPVADGQYSVSFHLYDAAIGGTEKWSETQSVFTSNGYFNTVLGNTSALNASIFDGPLWVGLKVGNNAEMVPRQKLGAAAYAMTVADGAVSSAKILNSAITNEKIAESAIQADKIGSLPVQYWCKEIASDWTGDQFCLEKGKFYPIAEYTKEIALLKKSLVFISWKVCIDVDQVATIIARDGNAISKSGYNMTMGNQTCQAVEVLDPGTYTYGIQAKAYNANTVFKLGVGSMVIMAFPVE